MSPVRPRVTVVGRRLDAEHHRLRDFLSRSAQPFRWIDAGTPAGDQMLARYGAPFSELPVVIESAGQVTVGATVERLADAWELNKPPSRPLSPGRDRPRR